MAESLVKFRVDARDAIAKLRELGNATGRLAKQNLKAQKSFGGLQSVLTKLALAETGRRMVKMAASFKQTQIRLELLTKQYGENEGAQNLAARAAKRFGLSQTEALSGITDIYGRLRPIGVTLKEIETTYMGFNVATKLAGVSAQQASGAFLQLSQALGSGRLQGDEYRSIAEQLPILTQIIAKEMGKPVGQIKKLASEGKVTSEIVIKALKRIENEGGASIEALMARSPEQAFKNLQNVISDLSVEMGEYLLPAVVAVTKAITEAVKWVADLPAPVKQATVAVAALATAWGPMAFGIQRAHRAWRIFRVFLLRKFLPAIGLTKAAMGPVVIGLSLLTVGIFALADQQVKSKRAAEEYNDLLKGTDTAAVKAAISTRELALAEAQLALQRIEAANKRGQGINPERAFGGSSTATSSDASTSHLVARIQGLNTQLEELRGRLTEIPGDIAAEEIKKASEAMGALKDITEQTSAQFQDAFAKKFSTYAKSVQDFGGQVGDIVVKSFRGMEDALVSFVQTGKLSFSDFARSIIADMTRIAIRQAIIAPLMRGFSGWLGNKFGPVDVSSQMGGMTGANEIEAGRARAKGGPVSGGQSYMVGERGPELFTPGRSGGITPNNALGGTTNNVNVSVDASGSSVEGNEEQGRALGEMLAAAIQSELVKQRRPGGLLAGA